MSQSEFEKRLNEVLDERRSPQSDPELIALAEGSEEAAQKLAASEALFQGLDARLVPNAPEDLADQVVRQFNTSGLNKSPLSTFLPRTTTQVAVSLAVAASLLIGTAALLLPTGDPKEPDAVPPVAGNESDLGSDDMDLVLDESQKEYLVMLRITGQAMATFPSRIREATQPLEEGPMAEGFRPVGASFSAALNALRQTLPHKPNDSES